jgi:hypothetical protein
MSNIPKRMDLRSNRLAIRAENKARNDAAQKDYETAHRESDMSTAQTFDGQFNSRYKAFDKIINPGCEYCGGDH